jgi:hypothetical protein
MFLISGENIISGKFFGMSGKSFLYLGWQSFSFTYSPFSAQYKLAIQMKFLLSERGWGNALLEW